LAKFVKSFDNLVPVQYPLLADSTHAMARCGLKLDI